MNVKISTEFNKQQVFKGIMTKESRAQYWFNNEVVKDSNYYAPQDTTELIRSAIRYVASNPTGNKVVWDTPYAMYQYKGLSKSGKPLKYSKDVNPNARSHWFEAARKVSKAKWTKGVASIMGGEVKWLLMTCINTWMII